MCVCVYIYIHIWCVCVCVCVCVQTGVPSVRSQVTPGPQGENKKKKIIQQRDGNHVHTVLPSSHSWATR